MNITEKQRAILEHALDTASEHLPERSVAQKEFARAIAIVRERPAGQRRVRSDFNQKRKTAQQELSNV
jgi:hypothetical protein